MRRVIAIVVACALAGALGGCSSFSMDAFRAAPPTVQVELDSVPPGADAVTSVGPSCRTPCSVAVAAPDAGFSVTSPPCSTGVVPTPWCAELKPAGPQPRAPRKGVTQKKPKPAKNTVASSPFPDPSAAPDTRRSLQPSAVADCSPIASSLHCDYGTRRRAMAAAASQGLGNDRTLIESSCIAIA